MPLTPVDYVILTAAAGAAVFGLFVGFSGALAFLSGTLAAVLAGVFGWDVLQHSIESVWLRVLATVVGTLVAFGLVRMIVRRFVRVMVAQPGDALFGALAAAIAAASVALGAVWLAGTVDLLPYPSVILQEVLFHVG